jgi:hypothetical protein
MTGRHATTQGAKGRDSSMMDCWRDENLTEPQIETYRAEYEHLQSFVSNLPETAVLVDAGCGDARVVARVALGGRRYVGVDNDPKAVRAAQEVCVGVEGAQILEPQDYREALRALTPGGPIATMCLGGTLGSFPGDEREHLQALAQSSCAVFFTVWHKSVEVLDKRIDYYRKNRLDFGVKWSEGVIVSSSWGQVRSWTQEELVALCREALPQFECLVVETPPLAWTVLGYRASSPR